MKDSTYWARQYTNFIERQLQQRESIYISQAWSMAQEIEGLIDNEQKYLGEDPAGFILLLYINDLFNRFDPIGVYPQSRGEYGAYARSILEFYRSCKKDEFVKSASLFLHKKIGSLYRCKEYNPEAMRSKVNEVCAVIGQFEQNIADKTSGDKAYWSGKYKDFIVNVLQQRQKSYQHLADCIQAEMSRLTTEKKENLKDDPESFVLYLYINYALNLFDPLAVYPETGAPYAACARDIHILYKSCDKERFINELPILLQKELGEFCLTDDYDLARNKAPGDCINRRWPDLNYRKDIKYATQLVVRVVEVFEKEAALRAKRAKPGTSNNQRAVVNK